MAPILFTHNVFYLKILLLCILVGIGNVWTMFHSLQTSKICYNIVTPDHMIIKKDRFLIVSPFPGAVHFEAVIGELSTFSFVCFFPSSLTVHSSMFNCHQLYAIYLDKKRKRKHVQGRGEGKPFSLIVIRSHCALAWHEEAIEPLIACNLFMMLQWRFVNYIFYWPLRKKFFKKVTVK